MNILSSSLLRTWKFQTQTILLKMILLSYPTLLAANLEVFIDKLVNKELKSIWLIIVNFFIIYFISGLIAFLLNKIQAKHYKKLNYYFSQILFNKIINSQINEINKYKSGDLQLRLVDDSMKLSHNIVDILDNILNPLQGIIAFIYLFTLNKLIAILILISGPLILFVVYKTTSFFEKAQKDIRNQEANLNHYVYDCWINYPIIQHYGIFSIIKQKYLKQINKIKKDNLQAVKLSFFGYVPTLLLTCFIEIMAIIIGVQGIQNGTLTVGSVIATFLLVGIINQSINQSALSWYDLVTSFVSIKRIESLYIIKQDSLFEKKQEQKSIIKLKKLKLQNISFSYKSKSTTYLLSNISLSFQPGSITAITGRNGVGKTTIFKLILNIYQPQKGKITINDVDISTFSRKNLTDLIAYCPRDTIFFKTNKFNTIFYERIHSLNQNNNILKEWHDTISSLFDDFNLIKNNLSQGEKKIIVLLDTFLKDTPIILLDEPTESLDEKAIAILEKYIQKIKKAKVIIIISHDKKFLSNLDKVYILK